MSSKELRKFLEGVGMPSEEIKRMKKKARQKLVATYLAEENNDWVQATQPDTQSEDQ